MLRNISPILQRHSWIGMLGLLLLFIWHLSPAYAADDARPALAVEVDRETVAPGETFVARVCSSSEGLRLKAADVPWAFDDVVLEVREVRTGDLFDGREVVTALEDLQPGRVRHIFSLVDDQVSAPAPGCVAAVELAVDPEAESGAATVGIEEPSLVLADFAEIPGHTAVLDVAPATVQIVRPARVSLSSLETTGPVVVGQPFSVLVKGANPGNVQVTTRITLSVDGQQVEQRDLELGSGEAFAQEFAVPAQTEPGSHRLRVTEQAVDRDDPQEELAITVEVVEPLKVSIRLPQDSDTAPRMSAFTARVHLASGSLEPAGGRLTLAFDPEAFAVDSVQPGGLFQQLEVGSDEEQGSLTLSFQAEGDPGIVTGSGIVAEVRFRVAAEASLEEQPLGLSAVALWDDSGEAVPAAFVQSHEATVTVVCPTGDFTGDCRVDREDITALMTAYQTEEGSEEFDPRFDLNGDRRISLADLALAASQAPRGTSGS